VADDETGKNSGVSCCSKQGRGWLKDRVDGQYRQVWLLPKPLPQVAIHYGGSHLQHEMSACLRPPHLLALDHPFATKELTADSAKLVAILRPERYRVP
jgi:hypothetical protein